jgi:hypothetical protein
VFGAAVTEAQQWTPATVSSPDLLRAVRVTRRLQGLLEASVWIVVGGSVLAFGAAHAWTCSILRVACLVAAAIAFARAVAVGGLRQRLGPHRVALHVSERWLVVEPRPTDRALGWSIDLAERALPRGPLVLPGLAFLALALLQLVPLASGPANLAPEATRRGITFVLALLLLHEAAAAAFAHRAAQRRFRRAVAWLGAAIALVTLVHGDGGRPFGPFVNRNHFAGYMLLVVPVALSLLADAWRAYARQLGGGRTVRRSLVGLGTREGTRLVWAALPPLLAIAALTLAWHREAHYDSVPLLVETGAPGLLIGLWAGVAVLAAARRDPWLLAALAGVLMHEFVDFDLQIPAVAALFVVVAALGRPREGGGQGGSLGARPDQSASG